jgi:hypothetical protein
MAVDTREKRQSAVSLIVPSMTPGVEPSAIDQAERQASAWVYGGILSAGGGPGAGGEGSFRHGVASWDTYNLGLSNWGLGGVR